MKLAAARNWLTSIQKSGLLRYLQILGMTELLFVVLFLWPRSMQIGFLLLTGYFGGAMAVEMANGNFFLIPGIILAIVWIAAYLRDASLFSRVQKQNRALHHIGATE